MSMILFFVLVTIYVLYYFITKKYDYWRKKKVPFIKPLFFFGNYKDTILLKKHLSEMTCEICQQLPDEPYIGTYYGTEPALIVQDPNLIKLVLSKDFYYFNGREVSDYSHMETITKNLFFAGGDEWKVQRHNLTPLFTSSKIKGMFHLVDNCAKNLEICLEKETQVSESLDARVLLARYTIDCITSCGFGFDSGTLKQESIDNPFMLMRQQIFNESISRGIKTQFRAIWPAIFYKLKLSQFEPAITHFFHKIATAVFAERMTKKSSRNDFVDLILTWKQNSYITGDSLSNLLTGDKKIARLEVNDDLLVAQCVLFFGAGFETTATTLSFVLYEIAKSKDAQEKVLIEVDAYLNRNEGKIEYECLNEMPYLGACITEALRLYPVLGVLTREVMADYTLPNGPSLRKGDRIHIPVRNIQHSSKYFPEPDKFIPERFIGDDRRNIVPFTFLSYGEGPRMCIGARFSKVPMFLALITIFKNYRLELAADTPLKLKYQAISIVTTPASKINLKFISRKL